MRRCGHPTQCDFEVGRPCRGISLENPPAGFSTLYPGRGFLYSYLEESSTWIKTKLISLALPGGPTLMALAPLWSHLSGRALLLVHQPLGSPPLTCSFLPWDCDSLKCYLCIQAGWRGKNWVCDRCTKGTRKPAELLVDQILMECKSQGSE